MLSSSISISLWQVFRANRMWNIAVIAAALSPFTLPLARGGALKQQLLSDATYCHL